MVGGPRHYRVNRYLEYIEVRYFQSGGDAPTTREGIIRILFDAYWWNEGPPSNQAVVHEFIRAWAKRFPEDQVFLAIPGIDAPATPVPAGATVLRSRLSPHGVSAMLWLPRLARQIRADITLTHNFTPLAGRSAVFIHDVLFQTNPEWFSRAELAYWALIPMRLQRAVEMVRDGKLSLAEIAATTGFADQSHLTRWVRRVHGVSPTQILPNHEPHSRNLQDRPVTAS